MAMAAAISLPHINGNPILQTRRSSKATNHHSFSCRPKTVKITAMSTAATTDKKLSNYWTSLNDEIDAHLKQAIPIKQPLSVFEPMHHLTFAALQTTAPALCITACELVGGNRDQAMATASALRVMHAAAFTHEHMPLTGRRPSKIGHTNGKSNPNFAAGHTFGPNIELLTGDGMIPFGVELLAMSNENLDDQKNSGKILRVIVEITHTMGSQGIVQGQYDQFHQLGEISDNLEWIDKVCKKKEGELYACASACGAILGGGTEEEIERLRRFGRYAGMMQGICSLVEMKKKLSMEKILKKLRNLALEELEGFEQGSVGAISSLVEINFSNV